MFNSGWMHRLGGQLAGTPVQVRDTAWLAALKDFSAYRLFTSWNVKLTSTDKSLNPNLIPRLPPTLTISNPLVSFVTDR
jgi:hypothetical protein